MEGEEVEVIQNLFREVLRARGFEYCDDGVEQETEPLPEELSAGPLLEAGLAASSTDHPTQSITRTLDESPNTFWSSRGSASRDADAWLLYKLRAPLCVVQYVQLVIFRARYQFGEPLYPPRYVSFQVGPSPTRLAPPTARYPVQASSQVQSFLLPASCPAGRFLRVNLHGRRQQQMEDMRWYLAVERVEAFGRQLMPSEVALLRCWNEGSNPTLPAPGGLPAHLVATALRAQRQAMPPDQRLPPAEKAACCPPAAPGDSSSSDGMGGVQLSGSEHTLQQQQQQQQQHRELPRRQGREQFGGPWDEGGGWDEVEDDWSTDEDAARF